MHTVSNLRPLSFGAVFLVGLLAAPLVVIAGIGTLDLAGETRLTPPTMGALEDTAVVAVIPAPTPAPAPAPTPTTAPTSPSPTPAVPVAVVVPVPAPVAAAAPLPAMPIGLVLSTVRAH